ncbi:MAG: hypothetical protein LBO73_01630 [Holosporaceae bacterium]|jgi:hypothetical protein|nr:hypothetical protein [Holosporaceae bacterium]
MKKSQKSRSLLKKTIGFSFLIFFGQIFGAAVGSGTRSKPQKCILSNGADVVLQEDFRMPTLVIAGIIFHTGSLNVPADKRGITDLIAENLIDENVFLRLRNRGIICKTRVFENHTEILAEMNPENLEFFFQTVCENCFSVTDLEILKKQKIIEAKVKRISFEDAVADEISSRISFGNRRAENVFNEKALLSVSRDDMKKYAEYLNKSHISVIVCGAVGYKNLIKVMQSTVCNLPSGHKVPPLRPFLTDKISAEITLENSRLNRSVQYIYAIARENMPAAESFFCIFDLEAFRFFEKTNDAIHNFHNYASNDGSYRKIVFYPKQDVSTDEFQKMYELFINRICKRGIAKKVISKAAVLKSTASSASDLYDLYLKTRNNHLNEVQEETEINNSKQFSEFCQKNLKQKPVLKIITKYRSDK